MSNQGEAPTGFEWQQGFAFPEAARSRGAGNNNLSHEQVPDPSTPETDLTVGGPSSAGFEFQNFHFYDENTNSLVNISDRTLSAPEAATSGSRSGPTASFVLGQGQSSSSLQNFHPIPGVAPAVGNLPSVGTHEFVTPSGVIRPLTSLDSSSQTTPSSTSGFYSHPSHPVYFSDPSYHQYLVPADPSTFVGQHLGGRISETRPRPSHHSSSASNIRMESPSLDPSNAGSSSSSQRVASPRRSNPKRSRHRGSLPQHGFSIATPETGIPPSWTQALPPAAASSSERSLSASSAETSSTTSSSGSASNTDPTFVMSHQQERQTGPQVPMSSSSPSFDVSSLTASSGPVASSGVQRTYPYHHGHFSHATPDQANFSPLGPPTGIPIQGLTYPPPMIMHPHARELPRTGQPSPTGLSHTLSGTSISFPPPAISHPIPAAPLPLGYSYAGVPNIGSSSMIGSGLPSVGPGSPQLGNTLFPSISNQYPAPEASAPPRPDRKISLSEAVHCQNCSKLIFKLLLRGLPGELEVAREHHFSCLDCKSNRMVVGTSHADSSRTPSPSSLRRGNSGSPIAASTHDSPIGGGVGGSGSSLDSKPLHSFVSWPDHIPSAPPPPEPSLAPTRGRGKAIGKQRKSNKRSGGENEGDITCDVCLRHLAWGSIHTQNPSIKLRVEYICPSCDAKYLRCTDCGGGGGNRLAAGKWRCKELFDVGRRTCNLSHIRSSPSDETEAVVFPCADLPDTERPEVTKLCADIFAKTLLGTMAVPEVLETGTGPCSNFAEVDTLTRDAWQLLEPTLRVNIEQSKAIRRYAGLRWTNRRPRKIKRRKAPLYPSTSSMETSNNSHLTALRTGKNKELAGFLLAEWDMNSGSVFIKTAVPWTAGDVFESSGFIRTLLRRITQDRQSLLASLPSSQAGASYPEVHHCWTILSKTREAKVISHLQKKRGFVALKDHLKEHSDTSKDIFPPNRETFVSSDNLKDWQILVKWHDEQTDEDWRASDIQARTQASTVASTSRRGGKRKATKQDPVAAHEEDDDEEEEEEEADSGE